MSPRRPPRRASQKTPTTNDPRALVVVMPRFLEWMQLNGATPATLVSYRSMLRRFVRWCADRAVLQASDVTRTVVEDYKRHLFHRRSETTGRPLSRVTQRHALTSIRSMLRWLAKRGVILHDVSALVELPKTERTLKMRPFSPEEVEQVLGSIDVTQPIGVRDRALLEMAYSTGMRRNELAKVKLSDIDRERGTVMVRLGKGEKDRTVPIGTRALAWLEKYLEEVRPFATRDRDEGEIFLGRFGKPMTIEMMSYVGRQRRKRACLARDEDGWVPGALHVYRHSAATGMLDGGADLRVIQQFLGHASIATTQIYTTVSIPTVKSVHQKTHPAERAMTAKAPMTAAPTAEVDAGAAKPAKAPKRPPRGRGKASGARRHGAKT